MNKYCVIGFVVLFLIPAAHAETIIGRSNAPSEQSSCQSAQSDATRKVEEKGKKVDRFGECTCVQKNTFNYICKVEAYFADDSSMTDPPVQPGVKQKSTAETK